MRPILAGLLLALVAMSVWCWSPRDADAPAASDSHAASASRASGQTGIGDAEPHARAVDAPAPGRTLAARSDRVLRVRTVDADGRAVPGTIVRLFTRYHDGGAAVQQLAPSDADGLTETARESLVDPAVVLRAEAHAILMDGRGPATTVDAWPSPDEPLAVVVPPTGALDVVLLGPDGSPWIFARASGTLVCVNRVPRPAGDNDALPAAPLDLHGRARLSHVTCRDELEVGTVGAWEVSRRVDAPRTPGETVRVELRIPADTQILAGRVVDSDGRRPEGTVTVRMEGGRGGSSATVDLADEGAFRVQVKEYVGAQPRIAFHRRTEDSRAENVAEVVLVAPLVAGMNDVGDVVLRVAPLLVSGHLVAGEGVDPSQVFVRFEHTREGHPDGWHMAHHLDVHKQADGRFEVRALAQGRRWRVSVRGNCAPRDPVVFEPGTTGLELPAIAAGSVRTSLLGGAGLEALEYWLVPEGSTAGMAELRAGRESSDHRASPRRTGDGVQVDWHALAAGPYRFVVRCPGFEPLVDFTVVVPAGGAADDSRLRDVDLRTRVHAISIRVTGDAGAPLSATACALIRRPDGDAGDWHGVEIGPGESGTLVVPRPVDLVVVAEGWRGVIVPGILADRTVPLAAASRVHVVWHDAPVLFAGATAELRWSLAGFAWNAIPRYQLRRSSGSRSGQLDALLVGPQPTDWTSGRTTFVAACPLPVHADVILRAPDQRPRLLPLQPTTVDPATLGGGETLAFR